MNEGFIAKLKEIAREICVREGCILYDLEVIGSGQARIVRVLVDRESEPATLEDCSNVSNGLSLLLDVEDVIPGGEYNLEVSTPGVDRVLREPWHYQKVVGQKVKLKFHGPLGNYLTSIQKNSKSILIEGELKRVDENVACVFASGEEYAIPYSAIRGANVVFDFNNVGGKKPARKQKR